ncbi:MAG: hypothetical protein L0219_22240 [Phycisphaerales bacterium]|nr:hypothetical protein [Phycisphaerales bacterium]
MMKNLLRLILCFLLLVLAPPQPQPLHNAHAAPVAGLKAQAEADRINERALAQTIISAPRSDRDLTPKTLMTFRGKLLLTEDFAKPVKFAQRVSPDPETWTDGWRVKQGTWSQVDGGIRGVALPRIYPVATLHLPLAFQDVVIQVDVRLDDIVPPDDPRKGDYQSAGIVLREADASHIASVRVRKDGFSVKKDRTRGRAVNGTLVTDEEVIFGKRGVAIKTGEWRTALIEVRGEEMLATLDGQNPVLGAHPIIGIAKGVLNFGTSRSASFRNLRVWEALPNADWQKNKSAITRNATSPFPSMDAPSTADRLGWRGNRDRM